MERKPFEKVMEDVNKWVPEDSSLALRVGLNPGYPVLLKNPQYIIGRMSKDLTSRQVDELLSVYNAAKRPGKFIGDDIAFLMELYRKEKYDPSKKIFNIVAVLKYSDDTAECYSVRLESDVLKIDEHDFNDEVITPQVKKMELVIGKEADYWDVKEYILICHQI